MFLLDVSWRVEAIDALRGVGILGVTPIHTLIVFAGLLVVEEASTWDPLMAFPYFFFFVSGMCLSLSVERRKAMQSFRQILAHVIFRYGGYVLLSLMLSLALIIPVSYMFLGEFNWSFFFRSVTDWGDALRGIGFTCLVSFAIVYYFGERALSVSALILFLCASVVLHRVREPYLYGILTPLFITGYYSLLKTVPVVLFGAVFGKDLWRRMREGAGRSPVLPERLLITYGLMVLLVVEAVFLVFTSGGLWGLYGLEFEGFTPWMLFLKTSGPYYISTAFSIGGSMFLLGVFSWYGRRRSGLRYVAVIGRNAIQIFIVHFFLLIVEVNFIEPPLDAGPMLGIILFNTLLIYLFAMAYEKYRVGSRLKRLIGFQKPI